MPSPLASLKLRTKTSYQTRSFQSCAAGVVPGVQALPGAGEAGAADGVAEAADGPGVAGTGVTVLETQPAARTATRARTSGWRRGRMACSLGGLAGRTAATRPTLRRHAQQRTRYPWPSTPRSGFATRSSTRSSRTGSPPRSGSASRARSRPWDAPPTDHGFKGGDLLGIAERLPYLADLGVTAVYLTPIFKSASNHRYHTFDYLEVDPLLGGNDALRELLDAAHARGMRVVLDGVFNHTGRGFWAFHHVLENGAGSPYRDWFHFSTAALEGHRPFRPYPWPSDPLDAASEPFVGIADGPARRRVVPQPRVPGLVGAAGPAQAQHRQPGGPRAHLRGRRALAALRDRRLAPGRAHRDPRRGVLAGVPAALPGRQPGGVPRRRDLGRVPGVAGGRPVRRGDELPAGTGDRGLHGPGAPRRGRGPPSPRVRAHGRAARRSRVRRRARAPHGALRPGRDARSSSTSSTATTARASGRWPGGTGPPTTSPSSSRRRCRARPAPTTATRSASRATTIPTAGARSRGTRRAGTATGWSGRGRRSPPGMRCRRSGGAPSGSRGPRTTRWPSCAGRRPGPVRSWSSSTRATRPRRCGSGSRSWPARRSRIMPLPAGAGPATTVADDGSATVHVGPRTGRILRSPG